MCAQAKEKGQISSDLASSQAEVARLSEELDTTKGQLATVRVNVMLKS